MLWFTDAPSAWPGVPRLLSLTCLARIYHCPSCQWILGCRRYDTHTVIHNPGPAVSTEDHWTKYASEIIKSSVDTELWATDPTGDLHMSNKICVIFCHYTTSQVEYFWNNWHGMLSTDFIWSWVYPFCEFHCWYCVRLLRQCKLFSNILWFLIKLGVPWRMRQTELCVLKIILKPH